MLLRAGFLAVCLAGLSVAPDALAAETGASEWGHNDQGEIRLISSVAAVGDASVLQMGLEFRLKPGWKIYWRSPGDAGLPPTIDWKGSDNLAEAIVSWPAPHRFSVSGLETIGYKDEVVLPLVVRPNDQGRAVSLRAAVDYLVCDVLCVPQHADLQLDLPAGAAEVTPQSHVISRFLAQVPGDGAKQGLSLSSVRATESGAVKVVVNANPPLVRPDLFIERADQMQFSRPKVRIFQGGRRVVFEASPVPSTGEGDLFDKPLTLTVVDGARGMEAVSDVGQAQPGSVVERTLSMLGIALLGGFILNLMPCVLPVLSIKVLGLIGHAGAERQIIRKGFVASAAGIVTSFLVLAAAAVAVKAAGAAVGWGIQFQQPLFLIVMAFIITLFAANMFGFFEISLPDWVAAAAGGRQVDPHSVVGHFASGAFATLLATPCSAPFLGTAVGFALARGPFEIFAIFAALGIGMAVPYLIIATWPALAQRLPRPGRWMIILRRFLALVLLTTAGWLLLVLSAEAGEKVGLAIGGVLLVVLAVLGAGRRLPAIGRVVAVVMMALAALAVSSGGKTPPSAASPAAVKGLWKPFDRDALAKDVSEGKVVFVDVTADWCITCQVNKVTVVYGGKVAESLTSPDVVAMEADWTRPDDGIAAYLASFGRYGIPFNAVYGPGAPDGIALPELLTEDAVLEALDKARKPM
jgi:suppressor for copper-sensitivity B